MTNSAPKTLHEAFQEPYPKRGQFSHVPCAVIRAVVSETGRIIPAPALSACLKGCFEDPQAAQPSKFWQARPVRESSGDESPQRIMSSLL